MSWFGLGNSSQQSSAVKETVLDSGEGSSQLNSNVFDTSSSTSSIAVPEVSRLNAQTIDMLTKQASDDKQGGTFYNPYAGLSTLTDGGKYNIRLPDNPEFIFEEEKQTKRRSWSENLSFYVGCGALGGALVGGSLGAVYAYRAGINTVAADRTTRLVLNRYLNHITAEARQYSNSLGVIGLFFSLFESSFYGQQDNYPWIPEGTSTIAAGFAAGALFRSAVSARTAAVAGAMGATFGFALLQGRKVVVGL